MRDYNMSKLKSYNINLYMYYIKKIYIYYRKWIIAEFEPTRRGLNLFYCIDTDPAPCNRPGVVLREGEKSIN